MLNLIQISVDNVLAIWLCQTNFFWEMSEEKDREQGHLSNLLPVVDFVTGINTHQEFWESVHLNWVKWINIGYREMVLELHVHVEAF